MKHITLQVNGMSCQHCVRAIEDALKSLGATGKVNLDQGSVHIEYNESETSLESIKDTIEDQGYDIV